VPSRNPVAVFILSDVRSGSTLLDQCLGAHPDVMSLGEVHWLSAYVTEDRSAYDPEHALACTCGARVADCPFWKAVANRVGRPLESLHLRWGLRPPRSLRRAGLGTSRGINRLLRTFPSLSRLALARNNFDADTLGEDLITLYDAVGRVTGCRFCVDSSKSPFRFRAAYAADPHRALAIVLTRDYRGVVHSRMKRGQTLKAAARGWKRKMAEIDVLTRDLPQTVVHWVTYEAFCESPRRELARVCEFLGIDFAEQMLSRPTTDVHHIGGSPSKFDMALTGITLDRSYENQLSRNQLEHVRRIVGATAAKWGY
jgi:hypothetical protein